MKKSGFRVLKESDFPEEPHWVILSFREIHVPGDERSRRHPGHGYPAHSVSATDYKAFTDEETWRYEVQRLTKSGLSAGKFVAFKASGRAKVSINVAVDVDLKE